MLYIIILMHMYRLQNCYYLDTMTSCRLKGFLDTVRFYFQGGFSFLILLRWAKHSFGRLRLPLTTYVTVLGLALVTAPFLFSLSIILTSTAAVRLTYIVCAFMCMLMSVIQCRRYRGAGGRDPLTAACAAIPILVYSKYCFWNITQRQDNKQWWKKDN